MRHQVATLVREVSALKAILSRQEMHMHAILARLPPDPTQSRGSFDEEYDEVDDTVTLINGRLSSDPHALAALSGKLVNERASPTTELVTNQNEW